MFPAWRQINGSMPTPDYVQQVNERGITNTGKQTADQVGRCCPQQKKIKKKRNTRGRTKIVEAGELNGFRFRKYWFFNFNADLWYLAPNTAGNFP